MGLKTNKATKTSRLNCQYVGSFPVKDKNGRKFTSSEQNQFVDEKLRSCKKKLITGMSVTLEVSPDGVKVLDTDEKTVKMAHSLRRISYATAESSTKLFAYVSHQPGTDMEIVCHTFLTKKKDYAEGLSAVLGKLFKQTFAYTLKRRDKLDEAAQKRGANRRWAKQQVAEGHSVSDHARNAARAERPGRNQAREPEQQNSPPMTQKNASIPEHSSSARARNTNASNASPNPTNARSNNSITSEHSKTAPIQVHAVTASQLSAQIAASQDEQPPALPARKGPAGFQADSGRGARTVNGTNDTGAIPKPQRDGVDGKTTSKERKLSAPPDLMPASPTHVGPLPQRRSSAGSFTEVVSPTWLEKAAGSLVAAAGTDPPPLPARRRWETSFDEPEQSTIPEVFDEEETSHQNVVPTERRVSKTLEDEDWYIPGVTRDYVTEMLETSDIGTFFVRDSQSVPGCYALTMRVIKSPNNPSGFGHYLIMPSPNGFSLQGFETEFPDISTLIRHHASVEDGLPCRLILAGSNPLFHDANGYLVEFMDEEDDIYTSLSNCSSMFQELQLKGGSGAW